MTDAPRTAKQTASVLAVVMMAYAVFILLGVPDGMLGVAWPSMQTTFGVALGQMGILLLATTAGFMLTSFSAGRLICLPRPWRSRRSRACCVPTPHAPLPLTSGSPCWCWPA